jgi:enamine deaminase RidA (YjgF/YER057c/UK114 family)
VPPETTAGERTVRAGHLVFASGQIASDDRAGVPSEVRIDPAFPYYGSAIKRQTRYILDKLAKKFVDAGTSLDHVVKAHVFHTDLHSFDAFDEVWREFFPKTPPCRATVGTAGLLVPGCLVAVDLIATLPSSPGKVFSSTAPRAPVSYSEAIAVGDLVFASGLMASDYKTGVPPEAKVDPAFPYYGSEIKRQTRYILNNFRTVLAASGTSLDLVVKAHVYLKNLNDFNDYDEVWKEFFPTPPPRSTIGVPDLLVRDALVEIDLITAVPSVLREFVDVPDIPKPLANYAPALRVGNLVFAAGALATDFETGVAPQARINPSFPYYGSAIKLETRYILDNLARTFRAAGTSLDRAVKAQVFLTDLADFNGFDEVWRGYFPVSPPRTIARTTGLLIKGNLIEIDLVAALPDDARVQSK